MNVCICTSSFPINKHEIFHYYLKDLINVLHSKGHQVTILTQNKRGEKELFIPNSEVVWFPWRMTTQNVLAEVSFKTPVNILSAFSLLINGVRYSKKVQKEKKIEIFLCLWIVPSGLFIYLKNIFWKKTPYILWSLGSDVYQNKNNFFSRTLLRLIIRNSKAVFADGFELCHLIEKIANRHCQFLPTFHKIDIDNTSVELNFLKKRETTFLFIGRVTPVKGTDILVEAIKILSKSTLLNFKCYIIGDGEMLPALVKEVNKNKLHEKVLFAGKITDEKIKANYFNLADCIVIPSRSESIPVVLSEAVQFKKPMIVTNVGDMAFIINKYKLGMVVEKENVIELADKMKKFITQPVAFNFNDGKNLLDTLLFENNSDQLLRCLDN